MCIKIKPYAVPLVHDGYANGYPQVGELSHCELIRLPTPIASEISARMGAPVLSTQRMARWHGQVIADRHGMGENTEYPFALVTDDRGSSARVPWEHVNEFLDILSAIAPIQVLHVVPG